VLAESDDAVAMMQSGGSLSKSWIIEADMVSRNLMIHGYGAEHRMRR
jgi:hypothetical protein